MTTRVHPIQNEDKPKSMSYGLIGAFSFSGMVGIISLTKTSPERCMYLNNFMRNLFPDVVCYMCEPQQSPRCASRQPKSQDDLELYSRSWHLRWGRTYNLP